MADEIETPTLSIQEQIDSLKALFDMVNPILIALGQDVSGIKQRLAVVEKEQKAGNPR